MPSLFQKLTKLHRVKLLQKQKKNNTKVKLSRVYYNKKGAKRVCLCQKHQVQPHVQMVTTIVLFRKKPHCMHHTQLANPKPGFSD